MLEVKKHLRTPHRKVTIKKLMNVIEVSPNFYLEFITKNSGNFAEIKHDKNLK